MNKGFYVYRGDLPHWRLEGSIYFVTWRIQKSQFGMSPAERDIVSTTIENFHLQRYRLYAYVVMDDHVHAVLSLIGSQTLQKVIHNWKGYSSHLICKLPGGQAPFWQPEYYDRIVRDEGEFMEKLNYVLTNPERRWPGMKDYAWAKFFKMG